MSRLDRTRRVFFIIITVPILIVAVAFIRSCLDGKCGPGPSPPTTEPPDMPTPPIGPTRDISLEIWTNDTKAAWMQQATEMFNARAMTTASGKRITVQVKQMDSGDFGPRLMETDGSGDGPTIISPGTIGWVNEANSMWQDLHQGQPLVAGDCPPLAYGPIGFGMWQRMAEAMGYPDTPIGWQEIVDLAADPEGWGRYGHPEWGQFRFGHTDPNSSNTGLAAMTSFVYASLGRTEGLTPELVRSSQVVEAFEKLESITYHYGRSTKSLNIATANRGKAYLHAVASSENSILATNFFQQPDEPLVFIFPKESAFWSENPFCVVSAGWVSEEQQEAAVIYRDYLLSREAQERTVAGWLRPVNLAHLPETLPDEWRHTDATIRPADVPPVETGTSADVTSAVQDVFNSAKKKATIFVLLDRSQSMSEARKLPAAAEAISGFLDKLDREDTLQLFIFNDEITPLNPLAPAGTAVETLKGQLAGIWAEGNTALYDAVCQARAAAESAKAADEAAGSRRLYGIILLSDGEDTNSRVSQSEMLANCVPRSENADVVKIFTIAYGTDADSTLLERIASRTNGKAYTADPETIYEILQEIAWEQ